MITIRVSTNFDQVRRTIGDWAKQARFATAKALTRTAQAAVRDLGPATERAFDRPTAFTKRAFGYIPARKDTLAATVFIRDRQAAYLLPQIVGGRRPLKRFEERLKGQTDAQSGYFVPGPGVRLNVSGNLSRAQIVRIAQQLNQGGKHGKVFSGVPRGRKGPFGIWSRTGLKIVPLLIEVQDPQYERRFDFAGIVRATVAREWQRQFSAAWADAMRTARR